ncbi:uncharacterized protein LOC132541917 isoform X2 [Erinaceus europaeus]|uniref:Uncharacterized protein LOC132541917 isoform X2 n=1 Tax=Erinaceus europaeus TaxID=9365 RepID=A0ABM3YEE7_ERIEU|nr:uncharacterized protein LOC132541917 isoform X2 [Erinaceus europaeus]
MTCPPLTGPRGGSSRIWHLRSALSNWERSGPRRPSRPAGLATFLGAGGGGRRRDGTRDRRGREKQGQFGPRVTPPLPQGPQQVDSAQFHQERGVCLEQEQKQMRRSVVVRRAETSSKPVGTYPPAARWTRVFVTVSSVQSLSLAPGAATNQAAETSAGCIMCPWLGFQVGPQWMACGTL